MDRITFWRLLPPGTLALLGLLFSPRVMVMGMDSEISSSAEAEVLGAVPDPCAGGDTVGETACEKKCQAFNKDNGDGCCFTKPDNSETSQPLLALIEGTKCPPGSLLDICKPKGKFCNCCDQGYTCEDASVCYKGCVYTSDCDNGNICIREKCKCYEVECTKDPCYICGANDGLCQRDLNNDDCKPTPKPPRDLIIE